MISLKKLLKDILFFPTVSSDFLRIWKRNFLYFRVEFIAAMFWSVFEPMLYLWAIGFGLGMFIGEVAGVPYLKFFCPAMMTSTAMTVAFFESTYGCYSKMTYQKTFATITLSPISPYEVALGEIIWAASKGFFSVCVIAIVAFGFGIIDTWLIFGSLGVMALTSLFFAALGVFITTKAKSYDSFTYTITGFITPMTLFCGTYFPSASLPQWMQILIQFLPLTHAVIPSRALFLNQWEPQMFYHIIVLIMICYLMINLAMKEMVKKIIS